MTRKVIEILICLFLYSQLSQAEGLYIEAGIGYDEHTMHGSNPQSVVRGRYELPQNKWWQPDVFEWSHNSSIVDGKPFNDKLEDTSDQLSVIWRFKVF